MTNNEELTVHYGEPVVPPVEFHLLGHYLYVVDDVDPNTLIGSTVKFGGRNWVLESYDPDEVTYHAVPAKE